MMADSTRLSRTGHESSVTAGFNLRLGHEYQGGIPDSFGWKTPLRRSCGFDVGKKSATV